MVRAKGSVGKDRNARAVLWYNKIFMALRFFILKKRGFQKDAAMLILVLFSELKRMPQIYATACTAFYHPLPCYAVCS